MRSVNQIVIAIKESQPCTEEELRLCVLALTAMHYFTSHELDELADSVLENSQSTRMRAEFAKQGREVRHKSAKMPVNAYLGPSNIPGRPEYEARMRLAKSVVKKATGLDLDADARQ